MQSEINYQKQFVLKKLESARHLQNTNALSKNHGLFDYTFWRDKRRDFADARFQEVLLTFALAQQVTGYTSEETLKIVEDSIDALERIQNTDGSFDEWYKGERGFAATCYPAICVLSLKRFEVNLSPKAQQQINEISRKAVGFLLPLNDLVKINHQAALVYLFVLAQRYLDKVKISDDVIQAKLKSLYSHQRTDGWFHEVAGKDLGYSFLLIDYLCLAHLIRPDLINLEPVYPLYSNAIAFLESNGTHDPRLSFCHNGYISAISSLVLHSQHHLAHGVVNHFTCEKPVNEIAEPDFLHDDLRFCRWSSVPLISERVASELGFKLDKPIDHHFFPTKSSHVSEDCSLISYASGSYKLSCSPYNGSFIKLFSYDGKCDYALTGILSNADESLSTCGFAERQVNFKDGHLEISGRLKKTDLFQPSSLTMAAISILSATYLGSRVVRLMADWFRKQAKTTFNQNDAFMIKRTPNAVAYKISVKARSNSCFIAVNVKTSRQVECRLTARNGSFRQRKKRLVSGEFFQAFLIRFTV